MTFFYKRSIALLLLLVLFVPSFVFAGVREDTVQRVFAQFIGRAPTEVEVRQYTKKPWKKQSQLRKLIVPRYIKIVANVYREILGRKVKQSELTRLKRRSIPIAQLRIVLFTSPEYLSAVRRTYHAVYGRAPTQDVLRALVAKKLIQQELKTLLVQEKTLSLLPPPPAAASPHLPSTPTTFDTPQALQPNTPTIGVHVNAFAVDFNTGKDVFCIEPLRLTNLFPKADVSFTPLITAQSFTIAPRYYTYQWDFGDGKNSSYKVSSPFLQSGTQHDYRTVGIYPVTLTALYEDVMDIAVSKKRTVTIEECFTVQLTASTTKGNAPLTVTFTAERMEVKIPNRPLLYEWNFGDGEAQSSDGPTVTHTYKNVGEYSVKVIVRNNDTPPPTTAPEKAEATTVVTVESHFTISVEEFLEKAGFGAGVAPVYYDFTVKASGTEQPLDYTWDFGDGTVWTEALRSFGHSIDDADLKSKRLKAWNPDSNTRIGYIYKNPGTYTLKVSATYRGEQPTITNTATATKIVTVKSDAPTRKIFVNPQNKNTGKNTKNNETPLVPRVIQLYDTVWNLKLAEGETSLWFSPTSGDLLPVVVFTSAPPSGVHEVSFPFVDHMTYTVKGYCKGGEAAAATYSEMVTATTPRGVTWGVHPSAQTTFIDKRVCGGFDG